MTTRNVRDLIVEVWEGKPRAAGARNPHALALDLAVVCEAHGVRLVRPALIQDPVANDWRTPREQAARRLGDAAAGLAAARAAIVRDPRHGTQPGDEA
jgi:hypothetical protein